MGSMPLYFCPDWKFSALRGYSHLEEDMLLNSFLLTILWESKILKIKHILGE